MATNQRIVYGASSKWGTDGLAYTDIPECKAIAVPNTEVEYQDATHLLSPGGFREYVPGLKDAGEVTIPCGYSSAGYALAEQYLADGTLVYFQTTMPAESAQASGDVFAFTGYVRPVLETNEVGDIISMDIVIRISGEPTFTEGPAA